MKPYLPIAVFLILLASSVLSSWCCYASQCACIQHEADRALAVTLRQQRSDVITPDTVAVYRRNIAIAEIRDTASISMKTVTIDGRHATVIEADAGCSPLAVFGMSDQRLPASLLILASLWATGMLWRRRRYPQTAPFPADSCIRYGGLAYDREQGRFYTAEGMEMRFTPMQHRLMEMFFLSDTHILSKQQICDALWPKKPDASDTLYTLVRRIKPLIERCSSLHVESERGRAYILKDKD